MMSIGTVGNPSDVHMDALITDDNNDTEPIEKSNLPLLRLSDRANVVSITDAVALKNNTQFPSVSNNFTPFTLHSMSTIRKVATGIAAVPAILL